MCVVVMSVHISACVFAIHSQERTDEDRRSRSETTIMIVLYQFTRIIRRTMFNENGFFTFQNLLSLETRWAAWGKRELLY